MLEAIKKSISRLGNFVAASEATVAGLPHTIDRFPNREVYGIPCWLFAPLLEDSSPAPPPLLGSREILALFFVMSLETCGNCQGSNPQIYLIYKSSKESSQ